MVCRVKRLPNTVKQKNIATGARATAKTPKASKYLEKDFTNYVIEFAHLHGWHVAHFPPIHTASGHWLTAVKADGKGWPDLVLVRGDRLIIAELKTESQLSDEQIVWLSKFMGAGVTTYVWMPEDLDAIHKLLR